jgi:iron complex transport system substrate-binding protein
MLPLNKLRQVRLLAGLALFVTTACFGEVRVVDDLGREIVLDAPAQRIVSLAPHNTENLFTAGAGKYIVGTVDHSDFPESALYIARVGNYKQVNIEAVLGLKPDLIIAWSTGNTDESIERLIDLGIPVFYSEPTTFELIISNIERFSQLTAEYENTEPRIQEMRQLHQRLIDDYASKSPVTVYYQVWDQPLITLNGDHSVSRAFEVCGGINVFSDEPTIAPRINIEGVIAKNPQLILLAGHNNTQSLSWVEGWMKWPAIEAVSHDQVKHIDADVVNRPTRRFLEGTREICELIDAARKQLGVEHEAKGEGEM